MLKVIKIIVKTHGVVADNLGTFYYVDKSKPFRRNARFLVDVDGNRIRKAWKIRTKDGLKITGVSNPNMVWVEQGNKRTKVNIKELELCELPI